MRDPAAPLSVRHVTLTVELLLCAGTVYNDQVPADHEHCTPPTSKQPRNCSATAYVDDTGHKSTFNFFEPGESIRGLTYFVQPPHDACYCDMAVLGRWIQCEIAESLCNPNMIKHGKLSDAGAFKGQPVDAVSWTESLIVASTHFRVLVAKNTTTPVQYYTTFTGWKKPLGYNEVNMSRFVPGRPDASVFSVPGRVGGMCADNVCSTYAAKRKAGHHPIAAFEGWK